MGIESRDYIRGPAYRYGGSRFSSEYPTCKWILIVTIGVFLLQLFITVPSQSNLEFGGRISLVQKWLELNPYWTVKYGQIWRLITYAFCHSRFDLFHIIFNMYIFWMLGKTLESMYGSREFCLFYLTAALVSGIAFVAFSLFTSRLSPAVGASGAVMGVLMLYALHYPRQIIYIFFVIPIEMRWIVALYVVYDLHPVLLEISGGDYFDGVAHSAHLGGLLFGYVYYQSHLRLSNYVPHIRLPKVKLSKKPKDIRIYAPPSQEQLDDQVDTILEKISQHGEASLTNREREILNTASRKYRDR